MEPNFRLGVEYESELISIYFWHWDVAPFKILNSGMEIEKGVKSKSGEEHKDKEKTKERTHTHTHTHSLND